MQSGEDQMLLSSRKQEGQIRVRETDLLGGVSYSTDDLNKRLRKILRDRERAYMREEKELQAHLKDAELCSAHPAAEATIRFLKEDLERVHGGLNDVRELLAEIAPVRVRGRRRAATEVTATP